MEDEKSQECTGQKRHRNRFLTGPEIGTWPFNDSSKSIDGTAIAQRLNMLMDIVITTKNVTSLNVFGTDTIAMIFNQYRLITLINALVITKGIDSNVLSPSLNAFQDGPGRTLHFGSDDRPL